MLIERVVIKRFIMFVLITLLITLLSACNQQFNDQYHEIDHKITQYQKKVNQKNKKKVLFIDSYHRGYPWSDGVTEGILNVFKSTLNNDDTVDSTKSSIKMKIMRMDTKRNLSVLAKKEAALKAKRLIEQWKPDLVIACDDNASKYLIQPYYKNKKLPIVFCGVNGSLSEYGYPYKNVTGMIEGALFPQLINALKQYAAGDRIGVISSDTFTERKIVAEIKKNIGITLHREVFVTTFDQWKKEYIKLQTDVDMLLILSSMGMPDFSTKAATAFVVKHGKIPSGATLKMNADLVDITYAKIPKEQGEWAAKTALKILSGVLPQKISIVKNKKAAIYLNMKLAKKHNIKYAIDMIERAHLISAAPKKVLFVNSYHKGYSWSDQIEMGLLKAFKMKRSVLDQNDLIQDNIDLKIVRMDTKMNQGEDFKKAAALRVKKIIERWKPNIMIASDDNAAKYLIMPYYKDADFPIVFCGVNWDASRYQFPYKNMTGMVEVSPVLETIELLQRYSKGERLGYLGVNTISEQSNLKAYRQRLKIKFTDGALVETFDQWKKRYLQLQKSVDMIIWLNHVGIKGWDDQEAIAFIEQHTMIPTGSTLDGEIIYVMIGQVKVAEEQGWWAGHAALKILSGIPAGGIPVVKNIQSKLNINMKLVNKLGIKLPIKLLQEATLIQEKGLEKGL